MRSAVSVPNLPLPAPLGPLDLDLPDLSTSFSRSELDLAQLVAQGEAFDVPDDEVADREEEEEEGGGGAEGGRTKGADPVGPEDGHAPNGDGEEEEEEGAGSDRGQLEIRVVDTSAEEA